MADAVKCDNCGAFAEASKFETPPWPGARRPLPKGWVRWFAVVYPSNCEVTADLEAEVCGLACMAAHSAKVAVELSPSAEVTNDA